MSCGEEVPGVEGSGKEEPLEGREEEIPTAKCI